jgi:dimeric dUTPase (all-alpha-NTP-PPase superfamily)
MYERFSNLEKFHAKLVEMADIMQKPNKTRYLSVLGLLVQVGDDAEFHFDNIDDALRTIKAAYLAHLHDSTINVELRLLDKPWWRK